MTTFLTRIALRLAATLLGGSALTAHADTRLAQVFGDHMVLQRGEPIRVWGWTTSPERDLSVELAGRRARARVAADGRWTALLPALPAGGPHTLRVEGDGPLERRDVLIGDVWLLGGQSNMEWPLSATDTGPQEMASPQNAQLRQLQVPQRASVVPEADILPAPWVVAAPQAVGGFSAIGYHFARQMQAALGVPIGLVNTAWGGSQLEPWVRREAALRDPALASAVLALSPDNARYAQAQRARIEAGVAAFQPGLPWQGVDASGWAAATDLDVNWPTLQIPQRWETQGLADLDGLVWMRRRVDLSAAQAAGPAELLLGKVDDCDETWVNGQRVGGECGYDQWRRYALPAGLLRPGANWIAVRVTDTAGGGGFYSDEAQLRLDTAAGPVPLAGRWRARVERVDVGSTPAVNDAPSVGHNGLIQPLQGLAVRGVLWYQGESNASRAAAYADGFRHLIEDWRAQWQQPGMPFFFVQLASFRAPASRPGHGQWAELREAQAKSLALPHTGMAVAIDVGAADDIHPRNKRTVGERLAALALHDMGVRNAPASGPRLAGMQVRGGELWLRFDTTAGGLRTRHADETLQGFTLAGADRRFHAAQARIQGDHVVLRSSEVATPVAARYAWTDDASEANLLGGDGLPAAPLRTDSWPLETQGRRYPD